MIFLFINIIQKQHLPQLFLPFPSQATACPSSWAWSWVGTRPRRVASCRGALRSTPSWRRTGPTGSASRVPPVPPSSRNALPKERRRSCSNLHSRWPWHAGVRKRARSWTRATTNAGRRWRKSSRFEEFRNGDDDDGTRAKDKIRMFIFCLTFPVGFFSVWSKFIKFIFFFLFYGISWFAVNT